MEILRYVNPRIQDNPVFEKIIGVKQLILVSLRMTVCLTFRMTIAKSC
ncbi:MAG: hypothetical protein K8T10_21830 [Candidatus Eremiobacteraeota bacterium]|nr:hypothetical protein [Candidatus Eremiobacteraeota bacterium]